MFTQDFFYQDNSFNIMRSLETEYEHGVSELGFSTNITLIDLTARKDFWELCNSDGKEETKRFERIREKREKIIQEKREKRHERWQEGHKMPFIRNYNESGSHITGNVSKTIGKTMDLKLSSMPGIILNPIDKAKYEKALENILVSKMRRVCMFSEDDADNKKEDSFFASWNNKGRQRMLEKREKEKMGVEKKSRLIFLKNGEKMEQEDVSNGREKVPLFGNSQASILSSENLNKCGENISENSEKNKLHKWNQVWERKWKSSEYLPKMAMRCQATSSSVDGACSKTSKNVRKCPDLGGVLVCKRVSGDLENRSESVNKIIEGLFSMDKEKQRFAQNANSETIPNRVKIETVQDTGHPKKGPEDCSNHVREVPNPRPRDRKLTHKKIKHIKLRLTSREQEKRPLVTSQQERVTKNEDLPEHTTSEPSLSLVCLKKLFPNAKLELH